MTVTVPGASASTAPPDATDVVQVHDLRKRFGAVQAVNGVDFVVHHGEIFGLLGPNGAGKTTTIEILEGLQRADTGDVRVLGLDPARQSSQLKTRIGVQLQTAALYPQLTVAEILALFGNFYPRALSVADLLAALDLGEKKDARSKTLSGGQQQRLSVALALVNDPELVFLDEPTTGLDPAARRSLWDLIAGLRTKGKSIVMTTHYMEEAEVLCDRLAIMDHGQILDMGTVTELVQRRFKELAVRFDSIDGFSDAQLAGLAAVTRVQHEGDETMLYTRDVPATIGALLAATDAIGREPGNLMVRRATLEDVFLDLTGRALRD